MTDRFTLDGDEALERRLASICETVRNEVKRLVPQNSVEAIFLGGGYGRGEGGVLKSSEGDQPYNDVEFYVCLKGNEVLQQRRYGTAFHKLGEKMSPSAGIEVEFKLTSLRKLQRESNTMFFYDLAAGHKVIMGENKRCAGLIAEAKNIELFEATRLLMNRCSGLLFSEEKLRHEPFTAEDADFIGRNQAKAQLAFGDVLLTVYGQYHWSCRERRQRLQTITADAPFLSKIRCHHALGVEFKLHPQKKSGCKDNFRQLQTELCEIGRELWLWLEFRRLGQPFATARAYGISNVNKCPETNPIRNALVNAKTFGPWVILQSNRFRYPRERILEALALLLWEPEVLRTPTLLQRVQTNLQTNADDFPGLVKAYWSLWQKFN